MPRPQSRYICQACGAAFLRWEGQCRACSAWNSLVETLVAAPRAGARRPRHEAHAPVPLSELRAEVVPRLAVGISELDRVLGGGLVPGSLVLVAGEPGIGKSTLLLQAAAGLAERAGPVLYATGEESLGQLGLRAGRLMLTDGPAASRLRFLAETDVEAICRVARGAGVVTVVIDSIQTARVDELESPAGSVGQLREAALRLAALAKDEGMGVIVVGHVTKDGAIAGPKTLEHLVDAVISLEGDRFGGLRLLRAVKNRYGSTDEVGVFEMLDAGLGELVDGGRAFLGDHAAPMAGGAVGLAWEGSRALGVEVQALAAPGAIGPPRRTASGLDPNRLALIVAVLSRRVGVGLGSHDIYANLVGGLTLQDRGLDLPLAIALVSSLRDRPVRPGTCFFGEVGLLGELRPVPGLEGRLKEAVRLGFERVISGPAGRRDRSPRISSLDLMPAGTLSDALGAAFEERSRGEERAETRRR